MVRRPMLLGLLLVLAWSPRPLPAGDELGIDLGFITQANPLVKTASAAPSRFSLQEVSELKTVFMGLLRLYQAFISSQDRSVCNFSVSCSNFTLQAVQTHGLIFGLLMSSDRLQRCNGLGRSYYPVDPASGRLLDYPIDAFYLGRK